MRYQVVQSTGRGEIIADETMPLELITDPLSRIDVGHAIRITMNDTTGQWVAIHVDNPKKAPTATQLKKISTEYGLDAYTVDTLDLMFSLLT